MVHGDVDTIKSILREEYYRDVITSSPPTFSEAESALDYLDWLKGVAAQGLPSLGVRLAPALLGGPVGLVGSFGVGTALETAESGRESVRPSDIPDAYQYRQ